MLKLKRLKIHKFRGVAPGTEMVFNDGFNILLGKNGAGKTTLLKLIAAAVGSSFGGSFADESLHVEYECAFGELSVFCDVKRNEAGDGGSDLPHVLRKTSGPQFMFRAEIVHSGLQDRMSILIQDDQLRLDRRGITTQDDLRRTLRFFPEIDLLFASVAGIIDDDFPSELCAPLLAADRRTHRLDEALDWLRGVLEDFRISLDDSSGNDWFDVNPRYSGFVPVLQAALERYRGGYAEVPEFLRFDNEQLPFLRKACTQLGLRDIVLALALVEEHTTPPQKVYGHVQAYAVTKSGTRFPLEHLSFGQLRLFAFFFYAAMHPHVIVADELTNGLHHEMIRACIDTIGERQAFLATQNPLLLDHLSFASAEEVQRTFILCDLRDEADGQKTMLWRNMTSDEAEEFFKDYQVGIQHVNDILRTRGLW